MIKNRKLLDDFEREIIRREKPDFYRSLRVFEELYQQAVRLGALNSVSLEGISLSIKIARIINNVRNTSH